MNFNSKRIGTYRELLDEPSTERLVSVVVGWEIAIKHSLGRLDLPRHPRDWISEKLAASATTVVPIDLSHAIGVADLPAHHKDPFDRLLISQARALDIPILTADPSFQLYDVPLLLIP